VVGGLSLAVPRGSIYGFLGQNGAGKTTTMRMLLGLMAPSGGHIELLGQRVVEGGRVTPARLEVAARTGSLVEGPSFYPFLSGRENLRLFGRLSGVRSAARVEEALEGVGLAERGHDLFRVYSRGMKQRLGIAAALLHEPELVLLDEPMNGLDPPAVMRIRELLSGLASQGVTIFLSSHLLNDADKLCSHVGILHEGQLVAQGRLSELCEAELCEAELECDDHPRALELLGRLQGVEAGAGEMSGRLRLRLLRADLARVNRELVTAGVGVSALIPQRRSLESLFLSSTRGSEK
jgi:ABC-type multidrug transport system ATPase subunit